MTREEAIYTLRGLFIPCASGGNKWGCDRNEAIDMAIEALQAEPKKAVPPSLADVYKWERDIALSQLEEYGIGFAEKKRDDLVEVVRCKDCRWYEPKHKDKEYDCPQGLYAVYGDDYCSHGERREP